MRRCKGCNLISKLSKPKKSSQINIQLFAKLVAMESVETPLLNNTTDSSVTISVLDSSNDNESFSLSKKDLRYACLCCFFVAVLNNTSFCVVIGSSKELADNIFFTSSLMTIFTFVLDFACFFATFFNASYLVKFTPYQRITASCIALFLAYIILSLSVHFTGSPRRDEKSEEVPNYLGFCLALFGTVIIGACQAIGEVTNLANLKAYPTVVLSMWGAGTGIAGLLGPGLLLFFKSANISHSNQFLFLLPTSVIMFFLFRELYNLEYKQKHNYTLKNIVHDLFFLEEKEEKEEKEETKKEKNRGFARRMWNRIKIILRIRKSKWGRKLTNATLIPSFAMLNEVDEALLLNIDENLKYEIDEKKSSSSTTTTTSRITIDQNEELINFRKQIMNDLKNENNDNQLLPLSLNYRNIKVVFQSAGSIIFHCAAVYFLEYSIYPGLVDRASMAHKDASWLNNNVYVFFFFVFFFRKKKNQKDIFEILYILNFKINIIYIRYILSYIAYNIGVTISRASVSFFPIYRVWILTLMQFLNCIGFIVESKLHYLGMFFIFFFNFFCTIWGAKNKKKSKKSKKTKKKLQLHWVIQATLLCYFG